MEGYTLKFVTNRFINETLPDPYLTMSGRLHSILMGIDDVIECQGLDLHFEWNFEEGVSLHNYKPNFEKGCGHDLIHFKKCDNKECKKCYPDGCRKVYLYGHEPDKCIPIGFKINGTNIECIDYGC